MHGLATSLHEVSAQRGVPDLFANMGTSLMDTEKVVSCCAAQKNGFTDVGRTHTLSCDRRACQLGLQWTSTKHIICCSCYKKVSCLLQLDGVPIERINTFKLSDGVVMVDSQTLWFSNYAGCVCASLQNSFLFC